MNNIDKNFELPYFITNKIIEYTHLAENEKIEVKKQKRELIRILLRLRVSSKRLKREQYEFIMNKYCKID